MLDIHVAVGVIVDANFQILLSKRPDHVHQGGKWEFPGGKVEPGETVIDALDRELFEELDIRIDEYQPLCCIHHDYGDKRVILDTYLVTSFTGKPCGKELQPVAWCAVDQLRYMEFPAANVAICREIEQWTRQNLSDNKHGSSQKE